MRKLSATTLILFSIKATASIIPIGSENNNLYYSIGGGSDLIVAWLILFELLICENIILELIHYF